MKIAHISDIHYGPRHLKWVDKAMASAVSKAIENKCELAVISGDGIDHGLSAHEPGFVAFVERILDLAQAMPVLLLYGTASHDHPGSFDIFKSIETEYEICVVDKPTILQLEDGGFYYADEQINPEFGMVICALPSVNKADKDVPSVADTIASFRQATDAGRAAGLLSIMVTHGTVNGSITESRHAMISPDHEFTPELLFSAGADAVMIGHIHAHQKWEQKWAHGIQAIAYPGSLARLVYGDHSQKGWLLWDVSPGAPAFELIPSPTRQLIEIEFAGEPDMEELKKIDFCQDDAVRVRWTVDKERAHVIDKPAMRAIFEGCDALQLEGTVVHNESVRAAGISQDKTIEEKVEQWLETVSKADQYPPVVRRLQRLKSEDIEGIIAYPPVVRRLKSEDIEGIIT